MNNLTKLAQGGFAQSRWLTEAAQDLLHRDPLDALNDAEALVRALQADVDALLGRTAPVDSDGKRTDTWNLVPGAQP